MKNLFLCSFASSDLKRSVVRFEEQAVNMGIYKKIKIYGYNDLSTEKKIQVIIFSRLNKRLYGYACWKAFVIKKLLDQIPETLYYSILI